MSHRVCFLPWSALSQAHTPTEPDLWRTRRRSSADGASTAAASVAGASASTARAPRFSSARRTNASARCAPSCAGAPPCPGLCFWVSGRSAAFTAASTCFGYLASSALPAAGNPLFHSVHMRLLPKVYDNPCMCLVLQYTNSITIIVIIMLHGVAFCDVADKQLGCGDRRAHLSICCR